MFRWQCPISVPRNKRAQLAHATNCMAALIQINSGGVYHHVDNRERYFRQLQNALRPGGRVAIIYFRMDSPEGPPKAARIAPAHVKSELQRAGHVGTEEHGFLPHQYFLVFQRPISGP